MQLGFQEGFGIRVNQAWVNRTEASQIGQSQGIVFDKLTISLKIRVLLFPLPALHPDFDILVDCQLSWVRWCSKGVSVQNWSFNAHTLSRGEVRKDGEQGHQLPQVLVTRNSGFGFDAACAGKL